MANLNEDSEKFCDFLQIDILICGRRQLFQSTLVCQQISHPRLHVHSDGKVPYSMIVGNIKRKSLTARLIEVTVSLQRATCLCGIVTEIKARLVDWVENTVKISEKVSYICE
jgi:hypothetical protein